VDSIDVLLMTVGTICAIVDGLIWPAIAYVQARIVSKFASLLHSDPELAAQKISLYALILVYISIVLGLASYLGMCAISPLVNCLSKLYSACKEDLCRLLKYV
jgi:hypothetical protein